MLNKVMLIGNLGKDPEVRSLPNGTPVVKFSLATSRKWKGSDGEKKEETEWHNVVAFGKLADIVAKYVHKGRQVYIEGRISSRSYEDRQTGENKWWTEIVADQMLMLGQKEGGSSSGYREPERETSQSQSANDFVGDDYDPDDDIPF